MRTPINRHRLPQLAADLGIILAAWFLAFRLRFDPDLPRYYEYYLSWEVLGLTRPGLSAEAVKRIQSDPATNPQQTKSDLLATEGTSYGSALAVTGVVGLHF